MDFFRIKLGEVHAGAPIYLPIGFSWTSGLNPTRNKSRAGVFTAEFAEQVESRLGNAFPKMEKIPATFEEWVNASDTPQVH